MTHPTSPGEIPQKAKPKPKKYLTPGMIISIVGILLVVFAAVAIPVAVLNTREAAAGTADGRTESPTITTENPTSAPTQFPTRSPETSSPTKSPTLSTPFPVLKATAIVAGDYHLCALTPPSNSVSCWGLGDSGQLGGNSSSNALYPVSIPGLESGVTSICAGGNHTCAVQNGAALCWGANQDGQLGIGTVGGSSMVPEVVSGLPAGQVQRITCGLLHTCAALTNGTAMCWGRNDVGQLGTGSVGTAVSTPQLVLGLVNVGLVEAGDYSSCAAVNNSQEAYCWGDNTYGQLGLGTDGTQEPVPKKITPGLTGGVRLLAGGFYSLCGVNGNGQVFCVGSNEDGQLGDGLTADRSSLVAVAGLETKNTTSVSRSKSSTRACAVSDTGEARCWGTFTGEACCLGNGESSAESWLPTVVSGTSNHKAIAVGKSMTCSLRGGNQDVWCWGSNRFGQLGNGSTAGPATIPQRVLQGVLE